MGYDFGGPLVAAVPSAWVTAKPVLVTLMHWVALVPHRLLLTMYRPPWIDTLPHSSQVGVSALAVCAETTADSPMAMLSSPVRAAVRRRRDISLLVWFGDDDEGRRRTRPCLLYTSPSPRDGLLS